MTPVLVEVGAPMIMQLHLIQLVVDGAKITINKNLILAVGVMKIKIQMNHLILDEEVIDQKWEVVVTALNVDSLVTFLESVLRTVVEVKSQVQELVLSVTKRVTLQESVLMRLQVVIMVAEVVDHQEHVLTVIKKATFLESVLNLKRRETLEEVAAEVVIVVLENVSIVIKKVINLENVLNLEKKDLENVLIVTKRDTLLETVQNQEKKMAVVAEEEEIVVTVVIIITMTILLVAAGTTTHLMMLGVLVVNQLKLVVEVGALQLQQKTILVEINGALPLQNHQNKMVGINGALPLQNHLSKMVGINGVLLL